VGGWDPLTMNGLVKLGHNTCRTGRTIQKDDNRSFPNGQRNIRPIVQNCCRNSHLRLIPAAHGRRVENAIVIFEAAPIQQCSSA
jgi:hypothetical protein